MTPHHKLPVFHLPYFRLHRAGCSCTSTGTSHRFRCFIRSIDFLLYYPFDLHTYNCSSTAILRLFYHYTVKEISSDCVAVYFDCVVVKDIIIDTSRAIQRERPSFATLCGIWWERYVAQTRILYLNVTRNFNRPHFLGVYLLPVVRFGSLSCVACCRGSIVVRCIVLVVPGISCCGNSKSRVDRKKRVECIRWRLVKRERYI